MAGGSLKQPTRSFPVVTERGLQIAYVGSLVPIATALFSCICGGLGPKSGHLQFRHSQCQSAFFVHHLALVSQSRFFIHNHSRTSIDSIMFFGSLKSDRPVVGRRSSGLVSKRFSSWRLPKVSSHPQPEHRNERLLDDSLEPNENAGGPKHVHNERNSMSRECRGCYPTILLLTWDIPGG